MTTTTSLHLQYCDGPPIVHLAIYPHRSPIVSVSLDDRAIDICGTSPADLLLVAEAFTDAARQLSAQLDIEAARAMTAEPTMADGVSFVGPLS